MGSNQILRVEQIGNALINLLFPNRCVFCASLIQIGCCVCDKCLQELPLINGYACKRCGAPLSHNFSSNSCTQCDDLAFGFQANTSFGIYTGKLKELIQLYKFHKRRLLKKLFIDMLVEHKSGYIAEHEILVPMPLSRSRYAERGFNQCVLIAEGIAERTGISFHGDILKRIGKSKPQSSLGVKSERLANMKDRFVLKSRYRQQVRDKRILLLDDVMTTGATASRCAEALDAEGVRSVNLLTVGRALVGVEF